MKNLSLVAVAIFVMIGCEQPSREFDLSQGEDKFAAYIRIRLSEDEREEVVTYWTGAVYSFIPGERTIKLFDIEGYNIARAVRTPDGYDQLAREMVVYKDPHSGEIMEEWFNPFIEDTVRVLHIWNDPANFRLKLELFTKNFIPVAFSPMGENKMAMHVDAWLLVPSVLPVNEYPENSRSDLYQAGELFNFFFDEEALQNTALKSVPCEFSWTRISDFLPWMRMGRRPGYVVYTARGYKMKGGFDALPSALKNYVLEKQPVFARAPVRFSAPNMTSWKYFKKMLEKEQSGQD